MDWASIRHTVPQARLGRGHMGSTMREETHHTNLRRVRLTGAARLERDSPARYQMNVES